jgi:hypothetical protein
VKRVFSIVAGLLRARKIRLNTYNPLDHIAGHKVRRTLICRIMRTKRNGAGMFLRS